MNKNQYIQNITNVKYRKIISTVNIIDCPILFDNVIIQIGLKYPEISNDLHNNMLMEFKKIYNSFQIEYQYKAII